MVYSPPDSPARSNTMRLTRLERAQQRRVLDLEIHGHRRPLQARDRPVRERHAGVGRIHRLDRALAAMRRGRSAGGRRAGLGLALLVRLSRLSAPWPKPLNAALRLLSASIRKFALTTTFSPALTPSSTSM